MGLGVSFSLSSSGLKGVRSKRVRLQPCEITSKDVTPFPPHDHTSHSIRLISYINFVLHITDLSDESDESSLLLCFYWNHQSTPGGEQEVTESSTHCSFVDVIHVCGSVPSVVHTQDKYSPGGRPQPLMLDKLLTRPRVVEGGGTRLKIGNNRIQPTIAVTAAARKGQAGHWTRPCWSSAPETFMWTWGRSPRVRM